MAGNATRDQVADSGATTDAARIRELMLANLFAVFNERDPERRFHDPDPAELTSGVFQQ